MKSFLNELDVYTSISGHPNIINFMGAFQDNKFLYLVNEMGTRGNLHNFILRNKSYQVLIDN